MSNTINNNHPLIKNANRYFLEKKYISIHSEDRDIAKYPDSSEFEITLPQEYLNVASARLYSWSFPANYNVFSVAYSNVTMVFRFDKLYNPGEHFYSNTLAEGIFAALYQHGNKEIFINIEQGFYNPDQMATELTNKFNASVNKVIHEFFNDPLKWGGNDYTAAKDLFESSVIGYNRFTIVYNSVTLKLSFGNNADQFTILNSSAAFLSRIFTQNNCLRKNQLPDFTNWGLPGYLGFTRCDATAYTTEEYINMFNVNQEVTDTIITYSGTSNLPRFYYGEAIPGSGDNGFWLVPTLPGAEAYYLEAPFKISFMGPSYLYLEIDGWNCIDETSPYNVSLYTVTNSQTNGIVNSSFAKIPIPTTPISQWFDDGMNPYKYWNPPAERLSKIKIKVRYHNGMLVQFGHFEYSFMIELNILKPQQERNYSIVNAFDLGQVQSFI